MRSVKVKPKAKAKAKVRNQKDPGFYFFVTDWLGCEVQKCSYAAKGLWIDMLCRMWTENPRGVAPGSPIAIASTLFGFPQAMALALADIIAPLLEELESRDVFSRGRDVDQRLDPDAIVNRRMFHAWLKSRNISAQRQAAARIRWNRPTPAPARGGAIQVLGDLIDPARQRADLRNRIHAATHDAGPWLEWWDRVIDIIGPRDGGIAELDDALRELSDRQDPTIRAIKGLQDFPDRPGAWLTDRITTWAHKRGIALPPKQREKSDHV